MIARAGQENLRAQTGRLRFNERHELDPLGASGIGQF